MLKRSYKDGSRPRPRARLAVLGLVLAAASLTVVVPAATATAATTNAPGTPAAVASAAPANCPLHCLCGYTNPSYVGSIAAGTEGCLEGDNTDLNVPGDVWNNVASIYNNGASDNVIVYRGEDYSSDGGHEACFYRQTGFPDMQSQLPGLYHHIWSNFWIATPCT
jgi:hypothetical protein